MSPSWSPDGMEIAYSSERTGQREIYIRWLETGDGVQLTTDGGNSWPVFSPAGDAVAWVKQGVGVDVFTRADGRVLALTSERGGKGLGI
ncbi:MAG: TolB family protein, partial [Candidatus Krumholzibacteriia bacterium]